MGGVQQPAGALHWAAARTTTLHLAAAGGCAGASLTGLDGPPAKAGHSADAASDAAGAIAAKRAVGGAAGGAAAGGSSCLRLLLLGCRRRLQVGRVWHWLQT